MTVQLSRAQREPNVVIFLPDQQRADTLACYGNPKVHAVNLNRLAADSVVFEQAYVTQPVCSPSRASLMTGLWPHMTGCTNNGFSLDAGLATLPQLMGDGYRAGYVGKWHLRDQPPTRRGFHDWVSVEGVSDYSKFLVRKGFVPDHEKGGFSSLMISNLTLELSQPKFLERHACEFIQRNRKSPFILIVAFVEPHSPYNGPFNNEHPLDEVVVDPDPAALLSPSDEYLPLRYRLLREWQVDEATRDKSGTVRETRFGLNLADYQRLKQRYLGLITLVDQSIGAILACLEQSGLGDKTIVAHTSDHGDLLGAHHLFGKGVMFEQAVRVPYLIKLPGHRAQLISQRVSHVDFVPTLIDLAGRAQVSQPIGRSLARLIYGEESGPDNIFIEWNPYKKRGKRVKKGTSLAPDDLIKRAISESTRTVISTDGWKLSLRDMDLHELYNLNEDPSEKQNLYYSGRHAEIIARCANLIRQWQTATNDTVNLAPVN